MDNFFINLIAILILINLVLTIGKKIVALIVLLKNKIISFKKGK